MSVQSRTGNIDKYIKMLHALYISANPEFKSLYLGLSVIMAVNSLENRVRDALLYFAMKQHPILYSVVSKEFEKINAKVKVSELKCDLDLLGKQYKDAFEQKLTTIGYDDKAATLYGNLITWRHDFVHTGMMSCYPTYEEFLDNFHIGESIITAFEETLV